MWSTENACLIPSYQKSAVKPVSAHSAGIIERGDVLEIDADGHEVDSDRKYLGEEVSTSHIAKAFRIMRCKTSTSNRLRW